MTVKDWLRRKNKKTNEEGSKMDDIYMISILIAIPFAIIGFCLSFFVKRVILVILEDQ